jgi:VIT1/CCC1 family predicted Fe2+/Mn2+ transporter
MMTNSLATALKISVLTTSTALLTFGAVKGHFTGLNLIRSALQTLVVGGLAAAAAFGLARAFG